MQRMQRKFGKFLPREADDAQVATVIHEYNEADNMLGILIEGSKAWRQAWMDIFNRQLAIATEYELLYKPIEGGMKETAVHRPVDTPLEALERVNVLKETFAELKADMQQELESMNSRLIVPAIDARDSIQIMKKVIKKREDRKLDYERYKSRAEKLTSKTKRSDREETALVKHEADLARAKEAYREADDHLRNNLPGVVAAAYAILPHLLNNQIMIQNALLAHSYTAFINFAPTYGLPSEPLEEREITSAWDADFTPLRKEIESGFNMLKQGKAIYKPMALEDQTKGSTVTGLNIRNGITNRRKGSEPVAKAPSPGASLAYNRSEPSPPAIDQGTRPRISSTPSNSLSLRPTTSRASSYAGGSPGGYQNQLSAPPGPGRRPSNPYFSGADGTASPGLTQVSSRSSAVSVGSSYHSAHSTPSNMTPTALSQIAGAAAAAAKKKPPPPPPKPKRLPSQQAEFVVALYDFEGQNPGDLSFREGDRIRVVKKTDSANDWWDGEVRGVKGAFPANYVQAM